MQNIILSQVAITDLVEMIATEIQSRLYPISNQDPERLITRKEAKETFDVDYSTLHRWDKKDYLKPIKVGGLIRYRFSDVQKILNGEK